MSSENPIYDHVGLVVTAGGRGTRFGGLKQFEPLLGEPLLLWTLRAFAECPFTDVVVTLPEEFLDADEWRAIARKAPFPVRAVAGGERRADSVRAGVLSLDPRCTIVAVHDGARPFPPVAALNECLAALAQDHALAGAIVAAPMTDTVKRIGGGEAITETLPRSYLRRAETPQVVRRVPFLEAAAKDGADLATDEAQVLERAGHTVRVVTHRGMNLKVTERPDIALAEAIIRHREGQSSK